MITNIDKILKNLNTIEPRSSLKKKIVDSVFADQIKMNFRKKIIFSAIALAIANWIIMTIDAPPHGLVVEIMHFHPLMKIINNSAPLGILYLLIAALIIFVMMANFLQKILVVKKLTGLKIVLPLILILIFVELTNLSTCSGVIVTQSIYQTKKQGLAINQFPKMLHSQGTIHFE